MLLLCLARGVCAEQFEEGLEALEAGNFAEAYCLWRPLAEQGNADAAYHLGWLYANGNGLRVDVKSAIQWWSKAAEQGHMDAMFALGMAYTTGEGIEQDEDAALGWYLAAADAGNEDARDMIRTKVRSGSPEIRQHLVELLRKPWLGQAVRITVDKANLRSGPGTGRKLLGSAIRDTRLIAIHQRNGWYQVIDPRDLSYGWLAGWLTDRPLGRGN
jgi:TPR repeat protein